MELLWEQVQLYQQLYQQQVQVNQLLVEEVVRPRPRPQVDDSTKVVFCTGLWAYFKVAPPAAGRRREREQGSRRRGAREVRKNKTAPHSTLKLGGAGRGGGGEVR